MHSTIVSETVNDKTTELIQESQQIDAAEEAGRPYDADQSSQSDGDPSGPDVGLSAGDFAKRRVIFAAARARGRLALTPRSSDGNEDDLTPADMIEVASATLYAATEEIVRQFQAFGWSEFETNLEGLIAGYKDALAVIEYRSAYVDQMKILYESQVDGTEPVGLCDWESPATTRGRRDAVQRFSNAVGRGENAKRYLSRLIPRLEAWEVSPAETPVPVDIRIVSRNPEEFRIRRLDSAQFEDQEFPVEYLIEDVFVADQPGVIAGAEKSLKTTIAIAAAVALSSGTPFLGKFRVPRRVRTFFLSGESGGAVIKSTAQGIAREHSRRLRDLDAIWSFDIPQLGITEHLKHLGEEISDSGAKACFIDPMYQALLRRDGGELISMSNLAEVGEALGKVSEVLQQVGCTGIILHHSSKGAARAAGQNGMSLSDLSMAGSSEFFRQWLLLCRRDEFSKTDIENQKLWMNCGGSAGHHGNWSLDACLGPVIGAVGGRNWSVSVRPADEVREEAASAKESAKSRSEDSKAVQRREKMLSHLEKNPGGATSRALQDATGLRGVKFSEMVDTLSAEGLIESTRVKTAGGSYNGFRLVCPDTDADLITQEFPMGADVHAK